ncbi:hypothetical protein H6F51_24745 [Cyanobacteria bacterium FACHB-DQ100]|nr:hypothetical protein [Cyanobacteria bacterium FACHB-DQ100]
MLTLETAPITSTASDEDERGSGRIAALAPTCSQCREFCSSSNVCLMKARAGLEEGAKTSPKRKACYFASLLPF